MAAPMSDPELKDEEREPRTTPSAGLAGPFRTWLHSLRKKRSEEVIREKIEELIDAPPAHDDSPQAESERQLLGNILRVRDRKVNDIMVPRADIVAVEVETSLPELLALVAREGHSRLPVYRKDLDDILGMIHIKDLLPAADKPNSFNMQSLIREVIIVAPSMPVLDLLVEMRQSRRHMALVVDEFGGIDGLVTIEDMVEEIVGEIEDEHDELEAPQLVRKSDGTVMADGRLPLAELEELTGRLLEEEARENVDTLGGLLFFIAGRVPSRGELIKHDNGVEFEVMEADARRVKRVRIRHLPPSPATDTSS
jgi:CBS domain containing-hemolysin-like protein